MPYNGITELLSPPIFCTLQFLAAASHARAHITLLCINLLFFLAAAKHWGCWCVFEAHAQSDANSPRHCFTSVCQIFFLLYELVLSLFFFFTYSHHPAVKIHAPMLSVITPCLLHPHRNRFTARRTWAALNSCSHSGKTLWEDSEFCSRFPALSTYESC